MGFCSAFGWLSQSPVPVEASPALRQQGLAQLIPAQISPLALGPFAPGLIGISLQPGRADGEALLLLTSRPPSPQSPRAMQGPGSALG